MSPSTPPPDPDILRPVSPAHISAQHTSPHPEKTASIAKPHKHHEHIKIILFDNLPPTFIYVLRHLCRVVDVAAFTLSPPTSALVLACPTSGCRPILRPQPSSNPTSLHTQETFRHRSVLSGHQSSSRHVTMQRQDVLRHFRATTPFQDMLPPNVWIPTNAIAIPARDRVRMPSQSSWCSHLLESLLPDCHSLLKYK